MQSVIPSSSAQHVVLQKRQHFHKILELAAEGSMEVPEPAARKVAISQLLKTEAGFKGNRLGCCLPLAGVRDGSEQLRDPSKDHSAGFFR